jgi:hypothetical protein
VSLSETQAQRAEAESQLAEAAKREEALINALLKAKQHAKQVQKEAAQRGEAHAKLQKKAALAEHQLAKAERALKRKDEVCCCATCALHLWLHSAEALPCRRCTWLWV